MERKLLNEGLKEIDGHDVESAFINLLNELDTDFQEWWATQFSKQQRQILGALSASPASSSTLANRIGSPPENLTYNLKRLLGAMIITKDDGKYNITDLVFSTWINQL